MGKSAKFQIIILSQEFNWKLASSREVYYGNSPTSLIPHLKSKGMQDLMRQLRDIITVGLSSCEGNISLEEERALERSEQLLIWIRETRPATKFRQNLYLLNMGHNQSSCNPTSVTAKQRRVVLIGVSEKEKGIDLNEALMNSLIRNWSLSIKLENYSLPIRLQRRT